MLKREICLSGATSYGVDWILGAVIYALIGETRSFVGRKVGGLQ